ncbi:hypothetical protein [Amycolatopsis pigmentata]|uniref:Uncharacterized protein n=1 Tax=Amycolatopsis pigmentata TaxID=450801 RepID=A0ABW5FZT6_9PSEU
MIGTRTRNRAGGAEGIERPDAQQHAEPPEVSEEGWSFRRTAWPNPAFIYESAETFDGLIAVDPAARELGEWHGLAVRDLVKEITEIATNVAGAPLLTLQCPAQLPIVVKTRNHDLSTRKEIPSPPASLAVRFAIALRDVSAAMRFELADRFRELSEKHGFGLWIADTRPGHRPGNWFEICHAGDGRSPLYNGDLASRARIGTCLPVTCAGPARVGSAHAIVSFLQRYPRVGVVSCAETTLADVAFCHLVLSIQGVGVDRLNRILGKLLEEGTAPARPRKLLRELFDRLGVRPEPAGPGPADPDLASDYQTFAGPAFAHRPASAAEVADMLAVWVSWRIPRHDDALGVPLRCLYEALDQVLPPPPSTDALRAARHEAATVEYLLCRATERSVVRGKAKLAVPKAALRRFSGDGAQPPTAKLCSALEEAWKARLDQSDVDGLGELTVAWRESWLGHWTYS